MDEYLSFRNFRQFERTRKEDRHERTEEPSVIAARLQGIRRGSSLRNFNGKKRERASAATAPARCRDGPERLDFDFLAHPKLSNCCDRFAVGAYFRHVFLPFRVGL